MENKLFLISTNTLLFAILKRILFIQIILIKSKNEIESKINFVQLFKNDIFIIDLLSFPNFKDYLMTIRMKELKNFINRQLIPHKIILLGYSNNDGVKSIPVLLNEDDPQYCLIKFPFSLFNLICNLQINNFDFVPYSDKEEFFKDIEKDLDFTKYLMDFLKNTHYTLEQKKNKLKEWMFCFSNGKQNKIKKIINCAGNIDRIKEIIKILEE